jgi:hypothetical protein
MSTYHISISVKGKYVWVTPPVKEVGTSFHPAVLNRRDHVAHVPAYLFSDGIPAISSLERKS